ncbi:MAG: cytochrome c family protein [Ahrensia sp.]|nr:cytochrome c family protein [Ahrensia sp.]
MTDYTSKLAGLAVALGIGFASVSPVWAEEGDAAAGEKVFRKCASCHNVGEGAKNKVGPQLNGIIGRTAGSVEGFRYGDSLVAAGEAGLVWNEEEMFEYLADPRKYLRAKLDDSKARSRMAFKLRKEDERRNVIAYLKTFSEAE